MEPAAVIPHPVMLKWQNRLPFALLKSISRLGPSAFFSVFLGILALFGFITFIHVLLFGSDRFFVTSSFPYFSLSQTSGFSRVPKMHLKPTEYIGIGLRQIGDPVQLSSALTDHSSSERLNNTSQLLPMEQRGMEVGGQHSEPPVVFHVTKEFGDAQFGGLGSIVTNLALVQAEQGMDVSVILPFYSFLENLYRDRVVWETNVTIFMQHPDDGRVSMDIPIYSVQYRKVTVYLIGPGAGFYRHVFHAVGKQHIYSFTDIAPNERDLFFSSVASRFLSFMHPWQGITHLQVHGSTNAILLEFWKREKNREHHRKKLPALVYTIHDYQFEVSYSLDFSIVHKFFGQGMQTTGDTLSQFDEQNSLFTIFSRYPAVFPAAVGVTAADVVTCVSHHLARSIVEGMLNFQLKEIVWDNLIRKARANHFFGVPNGVDQSPFQNQILAHHGLQPNKDDPTDSILAKKEAARDLLVKLGIIDPKDRNMDIALFVGRYQFIKGIDYCVKAAKMFRRRGVVLVVMGQALGEVEFSQLLRKEGAVVIDSDELQRQLGPIVRLASTYAFVPSRSEAFGLVGAEGLMYGSLVISSGVGGMRDFLFEHPSEIVLATQEDDLSKWPERNACLFELDNTKSLEYAIEWCVEDHRSLDRNERELEVRALMETVKGLLWSDPRGPAYQYNIVYELATKARDLRSEM